MRKQWGKCLMIVGLSLVCVTAAYAEMVSTTKRAKKYHKPDCPFMQKIKNKDYILQMDKKEAVRIGKQPCGRCFTEDLAVPEEAPQQQITQEQAVKKTKATISNKNKSRKKK